jgi:predicted nucleotidyltransferase
MNRNEAVQRLRANASAVRALGATALYLFGSFGRDEARGEIDLGIFIDYDPASRFSLVELVGIKQLLEQKLGVEVDVTTRDSLHPLLKADIEGSAIRVF